MIQPQSKYSDLFSQLEPLLRSDGKLGEFAAAKLKREINKIQDFGERLFLLALFYTLQDEEAKAIDTFETLIVEGYDDFVVQMNYVSALEQLHRPFTALERAKKYSRQHGGISWHNKLLDLQIKALDWLGASETYEYILSQFDNEDLDLGGISLSYFNELSGMFGSDDTISFEELATAGQLVLNFIESNRVDFKGVLCFKAESSSNLSIKYMVKASSYSPSVMEELNSEIIDLLIDNDLDTLPVVQQLYRVN